MNTWLAACLVCLPLAVLRVNSPYGIRRHPVTGRYAFHNGVDLQARADTVFAVADGTVSGISYDRLLGIGITIDHDGFTSIYGHLSSVFVSPGQGLDAGEPIGITGSTGRVTGEHLHFSIRCGGHYTDPLTFIYQLIYKSKP